MKTKKVIAINSSKRKMNTYKILREIKEKLKPYDIEVEIINLFDYNFTECIGCELCIRKNKCSLDDDVDIIMNRLRNADGIILSSPVYMGNVCGRMKTFIDRFAKWFHRPELVGKPAMIVVTTAASGLKNTTKYLKDVSIQWGMMPTSIITRKVNNIKDNLIFEEYQGFINHLQEDKIKYKPSLNQIIMYQVQKVLAVKVLDIDKNYWQKNNWINKVYYYDANISIPKKIIGNLFYKILFNKVKKTEN